MFKDFDFFIDSFGSVFVVFSDDDSFNIGSFVFGNSVMNFGFRRVKYVDEVDKSYILFKFDIIFWFIGFIVRNIIIWFIDISKCKGLKVFVIVFELFFFEFFL